MYKIQSFSSKLMLLFSLSLILPLIIMSLLLSNYFTKILSEQNIIQFTNTLSSVSNNINTYLDDLKRLTLSPYMYKEISAFMEYINNGYYENTENDIDRYIQSKNYSSTLNKLINQSRSDILGITFIPFKDISKGYLVSKYYDTLSTVNIPTSYTKWLDNSLLANGDTYFTPVHSAKYNNSSNTYDVFSIMRVIKNLDTDTIIGVIKIDAKESTINNIISSINISDNSTLMLMDQDQQVIHCVNPLVEMNPQSNIERNNSYNIVSTSIDTSNWSLLYLGSKKDLYNQVNFVFLFIVFIIIIFLLIALMFFRINSNKMIKSITNITSTMKKVRNGDLSARCIIEENTELRFISEALNEMILDLDSYIKNEYSSLIAVKNAEYLALQSQINPHFLCNILNGFVALNRIGEKKLLEDSIIQLSSLYRYTCNNSKTSTLGDEILFLEKYLNLQKLRFDDMIEFTINKNDMTKDIELPKLLLQPLVENSIKHGLNDSLDTISIEVSSRIDNYDELNPKLIITIVDNGIGFNTSQAANPNSTGLKNIKERIEYFRCGSKFNIESEINKGTKCYIEIPTRRDSNENINS